MHDGDGESSPIKLYGNIFITFIGAGILGLPYAFKEVRCYGYWVLALFTFCEIASIVVGKFVHDLFTCILDFHMFTLDKCGCHGLAENDYLTFQAGIIEGTIVLSFVAFLR